MNDRSLFSAVVAGKQRRVQHLLEHGADPDLGENGHTPLMQASTSQDLSIMHLLIKAGADVNRRDNTGRTALMHALKIHAEFPLLVIDQWIREAHTKQYPPNISLAVTKLLISSNAEYEAADNNGFTPADYALLAYLNGVESPQELELFQPTVQLCQALIERKKSSELTSILESESIPLRHLTIALHFAAVRGYSRICSCLLEHGADVDGMDLSGNFPVESASMALQTSVVKLLIDHGVMSDGLHRALLATCMTDSHRWPEEVRSSIAGRKLALARYLLERGANPSFRHEYHDDALKQSIFRAEDCVLVRLLVEYWDRLAPCKIFVKHQRTSIEDDKTTIFELPHFDAGGNQMIEAKYTPEIQSSNVKQKFQLGNYTAVLLGDIVSVGYLEYRYIMVVFKNGDQEPCYFITSETNSLIKEDSNGSYCLCIFIGNGHLNCGFSKKWANEALFTAEALRRIKKTFGIIENCIPSK